MFCETIVSGWTGNTGLIEKKMTIDDLIAELEFAKRQLPEGGKSDVVIEADTWTVDINVVVSNEVEVRLRSKELNRFIDQADCS